jgi:hypothetical protein
VLQCPLQTSRILLLQGVRGLISTTDAMKTVARELASD